MVRPFPITFASVCLAVWLLAACAVHGADLHVRGECQPAGTIVTLGDLVDLRDASHAEVQRLSGMSLFPTPAPGLKRFVSVREIQDMLLIRGIDLLDHNFRGATTVTVLGKKPHREPTVRVRLASASPAKAQKRLGEALMKYLEAAADEPWKIDFQLDETTARWIAAAESLTVRGEEMPTEGRQSFEVALQVSGQPRTLDVVVDVSLPPIVVVPVRAIPREAVVGAADVELRRLDRAEQPSACAKRLDQIVGKETTRTLAAGRPIDPGAVREPVLVRRGDIVSVYVRAAGIRVRTQAKARDEGARGELVMVESLEDRKAFFAHVSGSREVEVLATGVSAQPLSAPTS